MADFIEVHCDGERCLINTAWIEEIREEDTHKTTIYFAFASPNGYEQDFVKVNETYDQIQGKIFATEFKEAKQ